MGWEGIIHGSLTSFMHLKDQNESSKTIILFYPTHSKPGIFTLSATQSDEVVLETSHCNN